MKLVILLLVAFIAFVSGHAVLIKPQPFNTNPSTAKPCGNGAVQTNTILGRVCRGKVNTFTWQVVVGDGIGQVDFSLSSTNDPNNFDVTLGRSSQNPQTTGTFSLTVNVPSNIQTGNFLLRAVSTSSWNSCSYVQVTDDCEGEAIPTTEVLKVEQGSGVTFCSNKVMKNVLVPVGTVLKTYDESIRSTFTDNMNNAKVIGTNTTACGEIYKEIICDVSLPQVSGSNKSEPIYSVSYEECQQYLSVCDVKSHASLYPCEMFGDSSSASLLSVSSLLSILILSIALLF